MNHSSRPTSVDQVQPTPTSDQTAIDHVRATVDKMYHDKVDGLTIEAVSGENIIYTGLHIVNERTVTIWANELRAMRESWPIDRVIYMINDFPGFTPKFLSFGLEQARSITQANREVRSYIALVMPYGMTGRIAEFAIRATNYFGRLEHFNIFYSRADAMRWLRTCRGLEERKVARTQQK